MKDTVKTMLFFIFGLVLFLSVLYVVGFDSIADQLTAMNIYYYSIAVICIIVSIVLWSVRWNIFLKANGHDVPNFSLLKILLVGLAINNITPVAKLGGEPLRAYLLKKKYDIDMRQGFASVLAELTIFFIVSMLLITLSLIIMPFIITPPLWLWIVTLAFGTIVFFGFLGIIGVYSDRNFIIRLIKWSGSKFKILEPYQEKMLEKYRQFQNNFRKNLNNKRTLFKAFTVTIMAKMFNILKYYFIFVALGFHLSFLEIIVIIGLGSILLTLPTTPGSLGVIEGGLIPVFLILGVNASTAATGIFLERLVWFWGVTSIGILIGIYYGINLLETDKFRKILDKVNGNT